MIGFMYGENRLAAALGLPVKLLQEARTKKLRADEDWSLNGTHVAYSLQGLKSVVDLVLEPNGFGMRDRAIAGLMQKSELPGLNGDRVYQGRVCRLFANPKLIEVSFDDHTTARLRVRNTVNLRAGMMLKLTKVNGSDTYELAQRLPRTVREGRKHASRA